MTFAIKINLNLKSIDISGNTVHGSGSSSEATNNTNDNFNIATLFSHNLKLEELNLSVLALSSKDFMNVATLSNLSNLRKLDISNNTIDDDSIDAVITLLNCNINLNIIDIQIEGIKMSLKLQKHCRKYLT